MMPPTDHDALLALAHDLADLAAAKTLAQFRNNPAIDDKSAAGQAFDPVTQADRDAEAAIVAHLRAMVPDHAIFGEEYGNVSGNSVFRWVIDPVDGTRAFVCGAPTWGTLIGLTDGQSAVLGVMDQPHTQERFWGDQNNAYFRRNKQPAVRLATSRKRHLCDVMLSTTSPDLFTPGDLNQFRSVAGAARDVRYGLDCYAYCLVAMGTLDVVIEAGLKPYDIVALIPIIEGAGGCVTTWDGRCALDGGRIVASANPALHDEVLRHLSSCAR